MSFSALFSTLSLRFAAALIVLHAVIFSLIVTNSVYYDSGGFMGFLWWLGALWVLPIIAIAILAVGALRSWLRLSNQQEESE